MQIDNQIASHRWRLRRANSYHIPDGTHPSQKAWSIFALLTVGEDADAEGVDVVTVASLMHCTTAAKSSLAFHITKQELMVSLSATAMV